MVAAGSLVSPGTVVPSGQLWAGAPAKFLRDLSAEEQESIGRLAEQNYELARSHAQETNKSFEQVEHEGIVLDIKNERSPDYVSRIGYEF
eukprot:TRINITY_DN524_c0_g1_i2.p2 TRINITY_DN524_c0_g1~~TRINITY_DN524_c0_g1_i2.p2  ORF type:complete len:90 (-),score=27.36 TRINITY_DN524_c0_g1_i2:84-353(-)